MKLKEDQSRIKELLKDTITLLCKNGLQYKGGFSVEALIGITLDDDDVFLVSIKETVQTEAAKKTPLGVDVTIKRRSTTEGSESDYDGTPKKSARKRPPDSSPGGGFDEPTPTKTFKMEADHDDNSDASSAAHFSHPDGHKDFNIKAEPLDEDDELVFVKQEGTTSFSSCAQSGQQPQNESAFPIGTTFGSPNANTSLMAQGMVNPNFSFDTTATGQNPAIPGISSWASSQPGGLNASSQGSQQVLGRNSSGYVCNICSALYHDRYNLRGHLLKVHGIGKPFKCICGQSFMCKHPYYNHRKSCSQAIQAKANEKNTG